MICGHLRTEAPSQAKQEGSNVDPTEECYIYLPSFPMNTVLTLTSLNRFIASSSTVDIEKLCLPRNPNQAKALVQKFRFQQFARIARPASQNDEKAFPSTPPPSWLSLAIKTSSG